MTKSKGGWTSWLDMPLDEFQQRQRKALEAAERFRATVEELFPGLVTLSSEARAHAQRLQDGEDAVLLTVCDLIDQKPQMFESLADEDEGHDPNRYETALQRERIAKWQSLREVAKTLAAGSDLVDDSLLYLANLFRPSLRAAIQIAKPVAKRDPHVQTMLAQALDFISAPAFKAAATRAARNQPPASANRQPPT